MYPLVVSDVRLSEADFINLSLRITRQRRWIMRGVVVLTIAYFGWTSIKDISFFAVLSIYGGLTLLILLGSHWQERKKLRKQYASTVLLQQATTYTLAPEGITSQSTLASCEINWTNVQAVREVGPWYVVLTSPGVAMLLDSRRVQEPHSATDLADALTRRSIPANIAKASIPTQPSTAEPAISFVDVRPTFAQYLGLSLRLTFRLMPIIWVLLLPIASGVYELAMLLMGKVTLLESWQRDSGQLWMLGFALGMPLLLLYSSWQQYQKTPLWQHVANYNLTTSGMRVESVITKTEVSWEAIKAAHRLGPWVFLQTASTNGYLLDIRRVTAPATKSDVYALLVLSRLL